MWDHSTDTKFDLPDRKKKHKKINIHVEATTEIQVSGLVQAYVCGGVIYRYEVTYYPYNIGTTLSFKDSVMTHTR